MPSMTYQEALKEAAKQKKQESLIKINIEGEFVVPYKDGIALLALLECAEKLPRAWTSDAIRALGDCDLSIGLLPQETYRQFKMAALMGVSLEDLLKAKRAAEATSGS